MGLRNYFKIRPLVVILLVCAFSVGSHALAQEPADSTAASNTAATTEEVAQADSGSTVAAGEPLVSTDIDTTKLSWTGGGPDAPKPPADHSAEYKAFWYYFLLFFLFCVFLGIVGKALRLYELTKEVQGKKTAINWNRIQGMIFAIALVVGIYGAYWSYTVQGPMSVTPSASKHGQTLDLMFTVTLVITTIVFVLTHILLFGFSYIYAGSSKRKAYYYPHNNTVERIWTIVPAVVLAGLVLFGFFTWRSITEVSEDARKAAISLEVTGEQFSWNVRYAGDDNLLGLRNYKLTTPTNGLGIDFTDSKSWDDKMSTDIVLPVNKAVRVTVNSKDILHSFYIPDFKAQINAVPGMTTSFQFTPTKTTAQVRAERNEPEYDYILLCAKICGSGHYNMQKKVIVVSEAEYKEWLAKQTLYYSDDVKKKMQTASANEAAADNKIALNK
ncbi:cytochrome c oxidase subunit II [Hufsiella ginkgonis]|uniref:Cytochrome c oxidase subunit 2 n=1 Tax=Hufsiella ginkgonis TaxID=2695274 RepID=A0A7K1Y3E0_9SPHI|nr:cytochrome c oxidase subunit II [Hufsiella ginkgonis]MXV17628.1 cytochrome c oxidase subunit II [Hufsiella ginkgonis]